MTKKKLPKKKISRDDLVRLTGLLTIARDHSKSLSDTTDIIARLVGWDSAEDDGSCHIFDAVWDSSISPRDLLRRLGVKCAR